jgi:hypothetical protein
VTPLQLVLIIFGVVILFLLIGFLQAEVKVQKKALRDGALWHMTDVENSEIKMQRLRNIIETFAMEMETEGYPKLAEQMRTSTDSVWRREA